MKLFNMDLHISVIADVKSILQTINPNIEIIQWCISDHHWVFNLEKKNVDHIDKWRSIDMDIIDKFNKTYDLSEYDGFIVTHTPVFIMLYAKYNKPIYVVNSCRYSQPFCWNKNELMMNMFRYMLYSLIHVEKNIIIISNNLADQDYLYRKEKIKSIYIPSLCNYINVKYQGGSTSDILLENPNHSTVLDTLLLLFGNIIKTQKKPRHSKKWLFESFKAIIIIPYEISTMTIFEYFTANVPMIFPSKRLLKRWIKDGQIHLQTLSAYNLQNEEHIDDWIEKADYYNEMGNHIIYYDEINELIGILIEYDFKKHSERMAIYNENREKDIYKKWSSILKYK